MTDRDLQIQQIIEQNPGIQFREIMRSSGLKNGVLSHYLGKLEKIGVIKAIREPRQARFYPLKITKDESIAIKALRKQTPRDLLLALIKDDGLEFSQLVKEELEVELLERIDDIFESRCRFFKQTWSIIFN